MEKGKDRPEPAEGRQFSESGGKDSRVAYSLENINRCKCSQCPVQADSQCAQDKLKSSEQKIKSMPAGEVPPPEDVPGIYCSTGKATCQDLDPGRQCICGTCDVWKEYNLKEGDPNNHFCHHGRAP
ncbi:DUF2769 domain-containing protein [Methanosarcina hadiensis]|uniref:DUF2769 domain-containing protein n=1 Tax=Methanosarcina hadiensis TaxID=3078083 RepID=UPI003977D1B4